MQRDGKVVIHPDTGALFKTYVSAELMDKMTSAEGQLYDEEHKAGTTTIPLPTLTGSLFSASPMPPLMT